MTVGVEIEDVAIPLDRDPPERLLIRIYRSASSLLPVVVFLPGLTGNGSADGLAREFAARVTAAVVLPETPLDPRQSATLSHGSALLRWLAENGTRRNLDSANVVMFGEGLGAASARLLTGDGGGPCWPVVSSPLILRPGAVPAALGFDARSRRRFEPVVVALEAALVQGKPQGNSG